MKQTAACLTAVLERQSNDTQPNLRIEMPILRDCLRACSFDGAVCGGVDMIRAIIADVIAVVSLFAIGWIFLVIGYGVTG